MTTQGSSRKLPILKKEEHHLARPVLPSNFRNATFNVVFIHLIIKCTLALGRAALIAFAEGFLDPRFLHIPLNSGDRPLKDDEVASSATMCKPITSFECLRNNAGPEFHRLCDSERLLLNEETEELAVRPILHRNNPDAGSRAQTHNIPRIQKRPDPFPIGSFPHLLSLHRPNWPSSKKKESALNNHTHRVQATQRFRQCCHRAFQTIFSQNHSGSVSALNVVLSSWIVKFIVSVPCRFSLSKRAFAF